MYRWDIINHFIEKRDLRNYLEIGYYKGWSFDRVNCQHKSAVDPNPSKTIEQERMGDPSPFNWMKLGEYQGLIKSTSDEFFSRLSNKANYDIVFIDGLHEANQVGRDVENSLDHLEDNGVIILHDCSPSSYEMTTTGVPGTGEWTGDCYKALIRFREFTEYFTCVVDTDYGVGVIDTSRPSELLLSNEEVQKACDSWDYFNENRKSLLNLVSTEEFLSLFK